MRVYRVTYGGRRDYFRTRLQAQSFAQTLIARGQLPEMHPPETVRDYSQAAVIAQCNHRAYQEVIENERRLRRASRRRDRASERMVNQITEQMISGEDAVVDRMARDIADEIDGRVLSELGREGRIVRRADPNRSGIGTSRRPHIVVSGVDTEGNRGAASTVRVDMEAIRPTSIRDIERVLRIYEPAPAAKKFKTKKEKAKPVGSLLTPPKRKLEL
jgi:hypothetical protein